MIILFLIPKRGDIKIQARRKLQKTGGGDTLSFEKQRGRNLEIYLENRVFFGQKR